MVRFGKVALALAISVYAVNSAVAQRPGGGGGMGRGGIAGQLAENKQLQDELKLDKEQIDKIKTALGKVREDMKDDLAKLREEGTSREDRQAIGKKLAEATNKALADVLKPEQTKRLQQIENQMMGLRLFSQEKVQSALKLTDEQKDKIKAIGEENQKKMAELREGGFNPENLKKMTELRKESMAAAVKLLNEEQKKTYEDLVGKPFELQRTGRRADN
jgi:Spy/CpxP family protein refolding chaperone